MSTVGDDSRSSSVRRAPEAVERALLEGTLSRLNTFELDCQIGRGGMGAVWRAHDRVLGRSVALKVMADASRSPGLLRRFVVEAQLGAQLEHPNIVPFYEFLKSESGEPAFAMKLVEGQTLHEYLARCAASHAESQRPPHDLLSRLEHFLKICDALDYAHARGVVHRDLKPANVMLGPHREVYVMDWGVARVLDDAAEDIGIASSLSAEPQITLEGEVVGTPCYMAPEQARAEAVASPADLYALGMMLAEMATLLPPREGSTSQQLSQAVLGAPPKLEGRFGEVLPRELRAIILKATARAPQQRYASVVDLAEDVRRFVRDESVSVLPDPSWLRLWRRLKRRPWVVFGTLAACLAVSSLVLVLGLWRELQARERAIHQSELIFALTDVVDQAARHIDARFGRMELLLEGMAEAATQVARRPPEQSRPAFTPAELGRTALPLFVPRYAQKVTFERSVVVPSPGVGAAALAPVLLHLGDFEDLLVRTSARAAAGAEALGFSLQRQRDVARERSPILWTDLAFENGVLLVYPGNTFFPEGFETRARSWYTAGAGRLGHVWGSPYPDATSGALLVPCSRAFYHADGRLAGVAALHMRMEDVQQALVISGVEGYQGSVLLDADGQVVVSEPTRNPKLEPGIHANQPIERRPFEVPSVRAAIAAGAREGRFLHDERLTVLRALDTPDWFLAVTVLAEPYGLR